MNILFRRMQSLHENVYNVLLIIPRSKNNETQGKAQKHQTNEKNLP